MRFVVCVGRDGLGDISGDDLTLGRLYEVIEEADAHGMLRVMDDSGEDYLYPEDLFAPVEITVKMAEKLRNVLYST